MVLVRQDGDDDNSDTISVSTAPREFSLESTEHIVLVTSMASHPDGQVFFCGKEDGLVWLYDTKSGRQNCKLFSHANGVSISSISFDLESNTLISIDNSSRVKVHRLKQGREAWEAPDTLFDYRTGTPVKQALTNCGATRILVSTGNGDMLWCVSSKESSTVINTILWEKRGPFRWATHPRDHGQLILISNFVAHLYEWQSLRRLTGEEEILLEGSILPELAIRSINACFNNTTIATTFGEDLRPDSKSKLLLWDTADFDIDSRIAAPIPKYHSLADQVMTIVGDDGQRLVFLRSDGWISSADPRSANADQYDRHFFLPADWLSTSTSLMIEVTHDGDIVFVKRDEVAVIKRGLENIEEDASSGPGKKPSLLGRESRKWLSLKLPARHFESNLE